MFQKYKVFRKSKVFLKYKMLLKCKELRDLCLTALLTLPSPCSLQHAFNYLKVAAIGFRPSLQFTLRAVPRLRLTHCVVIMAMLLLPISAYSEQKPNLDAKISKKILVMGDSLSAAYKLPVEDGWVYHLQTRLKQQNRDVEVINASVSGATTAAGLQILPDALLVHKPDIVILELGANDGLQGKPVPYITKNLSKLIEIVKADGAKILIVGIKLPPNFGRRYTQPFFAQYEALAQTYQLPLVPFLLEGVAGNRELMQRDGLHPTAEGQPLVLENVWSVLKTLLAP